MPTALADCNLLYGLLALQMDYVSRDELIETMQIWAFDKQTPLGRILRDRGHLSTEDHDAMELMLRRHLAVSVAPRSRTASSPSPTPRSRPASAACRPLPPRRCPRRAPCRPRTTLTPRPAMPAPLRSTIGTDPASPRRMPGAGWRGERRPGHRTEEHRTRPLWAAILSGSVDSHRRPTDATEGRRPWAPRRGLGRLRAGPAAGPLVRQRPATQGQPGLLPRPVGCPGQRHRLGDAPGLLPLVQDGPAAAEAIGCNSTPAAPPGGTWPSNPSGSIIRSGFVR
jgi:hypothetical protein